MLGEESHFDQVSDPGGGSFYIEALTASTAAEAWKVYEDGHAQPRWLRHDLQVPVG